MNYNSECHGSYLVVRVSLNLIVRGNFWHAGRRWYGGGSGRRLTKWGDRMDMRRVRWRSFKFSRNDVGNSCWHMVRSSPEAEIPAARVNNYYI